MTKKIKKILFCDNSLKDQINFRGDVINSYAADGVEVLLVSPLNCEYKPEYPNIHHIDIELNRSGKNPLRELRYLRTLYRIFDKEKPDYIFTYTIKPNIYGSIAAHLCKIPSTAMIAGLGYVFNKKGIGNWIARNLYRFALRFPEYIFVLNSVNRKIVLEKRIATERQLILLTGGEGINLEKYKSKSHAHKIFNDSSSII